MAHSTNRASRRSRRNKERVHERPQTTPVEVRLRPLRYPRSPPRKPRPPACGSALPRRSYGRRNVMTTYSPAVSGGRAVLAGVV
jgi:hypothetical protein